MAWERSLHLNSWKLKWQYAPGKPTNKKQFQAAYADARVSQQKERFIIFSDFRVLNRHYYPPPNKDPILEHDRNRNKWKIDVIKQEHFTREMTTFTTLTGRGYI